MADYKEFVRFFKEYCPEERPRKILDVPCGSGGLAFGLSIVYPRSQVCGIDINYEGLANGIARGNFKRATPIQGNAYDLVSENPVFREVDLDPKYFNGGFGDVTKLNFRELKQKLKDFDLVMAINPMSRLSDEDVNMLIRKHPIGKTPIPLSILSAPLKTGGYMVYAGEIAEIRAGLHGGVTPKELKENKNYVIKCLEKLVDDGERKNLSAIGSKLIGDADSVDLATLFKKV